MEVVQGQLFVAAAGARNAAAAAPGARPLPALLDVGEFAGIPSSPGDFYILEASDVIQAQPGNTVVGNIQVIAGASGACAALATPPASAPGACTQQNLSLPLSLPQLSYLHKVIQLREIGAHDDEQVCIPAQCAMSQHLLKNWQPYLQLQH